MYWYRILNGGRGYYPQYRRGVNGHWQFYRAGATRTWEEAYTFLEKRANPAILAVRFVGTF